MKTPAQRNCSFNSRSLYNTEKLKTVLVFNFFPFLVRLVSANFLNVVFYMAYAARRAGPLKHPFLQHTFPPFRVLPGGGGLSFWPQGFWGSGEKGYLFSGSWGALLIILGELGSKLQYRALRLVYSDFDSSYEELLKRANMNTLKLTRIRKIALETFKILNNLSPSFFNQFQITDWWYVSGTTLVGPRPTQTVSWHILSVLCIL